MGVLTIRNVDDNVIAALKRQAKANHRSLEGELRHVLARHAVPKPTLGVVRERARMSAGYEVAPNVPNTTPEAADPRTGGRVWLGDMSDVGEIVGDLVSRAVGPSEWTALRAEAVDPSAGSPSVPTSRPCPASDRRCGLPSSRRIAHQESEQRGPHQPQHDAHGQGGGDGCGPQSLDPSASSSAATAPTPSLHTKRKHRAG